MLIKSKSLSDAAWKDLVAKNKLKDNGLLKVLERLKKFGDDDFDDALKALDEAAKLAGQLKKDKAVAAAAPAAKFIGELISAADSTQREITKAKADADKKKAEAEKKAAEAAKKADAEDDDEEETPELLTTKLKPLLRLVTKGETMHALLAKAGNRVVVMLSRKPIPPARRKILADQLGGGSTKYYPGTCGLEAGATTFALKAEVAGMSKLVKAALLEQTGLRLNKIKCRGEDGDDHDDDGDDDDTPTADPKAGDAKAAPASGGAAAPHAFQPTEAGRPAPVVAPIDASEMRDEEVAADICNKQVAILKGWETALHVFDKTMTSSADKEATPDFQKVVLNHFRDKLIGELVTTIAAENQFPALAGERLGRLSQSIAGQGADLEAELQRAGHGIERSKHSQPLSKRYSVSSELEIHRRFFHEAPPGSASPSPGAEMWSDAAPGEMSAVPSIRGDTVLVMTPAPGAGGSEAAEKPSSLGDNVELF